MKFLKDFFRAAVGCLLVPLFHFPRLAYIALQISYAYVFNRHDTLTADPNEHLKRARKLLQGQPASILYSALEVRFALERIAQRELFFTERISNRHLDEYDPVKKVRALRRADPRSAHPHHVYFVDRALGIRLDWGQYKPLDQDKAAYYKGRLGDLLHPKDGLRLGLWNDPWYSETREFLSEAIAYLAGVAEDNTPFFALQNLDNFEVVEEGNLEAA